MTSGNELKNSEKLARTLFKIANAANTTQDLNELYASIHRSLNHILDATNFYIALYDKKNDVLSFPYNVDTKDGVLKDIKQASKSSSVTQEVIQKNKPLFYTKKQSISRAKAMGMGFSGSPAELWLGTPLKTKKGVIGAIVVQSYDNPDIYDQRDMDLMIAVSDQVAMAIDKKREEKARIRSELLNKIFFTISNAVNTTDNLDELYESIFHTLHQLKHLPNFFICIVDEIKKLMHFPFYADEFDGAPFKGAMQYNDKSRFLTLDVIKSKKPVLLNKNQLNKRHKGNRATGTQAIVWLGVPLLIKGKVIGVMAVQHYSDPDYFTREDVEIFVAVSDQIALAVERKRSEEALAISREQLEIISNQTEQFSMAAASMISAKNPKHTFRQISQAIVKYSNYKEVAIFYLTEKAPYHEILAYDGLSSKNIERYKNTVIRPSFLNAFLQNGEKIGQFSVLIKSSSFQKAYRVKPAAKIKQPSPGPSSDSWDKDDMLFVKMLDASKKLIGFIFVDNPMLRKKPTDESVRPLEIFSSLVSQIIIHTKSQEELKIAKNAAEASANSKSEFLANMSHEIRTPMNAIMGLTELVLNTELDEKQRDYLNKVKSSSTSLLGIINDILDFSKIDAGKMNIEKIDFRLDDVMESVSDMFSPKTAEKEIEFIISISNEIPVKLIGDPLRLRQALINLTGNSVKFTEKGEIIVSVSCLEKNAGYITLGFTVQDTGIGIPKDRLNTLFDSFVQADGSTTRKYGGTGLGLSISKQLIELMGGRLEVKSKAGKGTTFSFDLRFKTQKTRFRKTALTEELKEMNVLVVDDNQAARDIMGETLSSFGFHVKAVDSGEKAVKELEKAQRKGSPFKLVMLDLIMPGLDGIETAKRIRKNPDMADISIIMMTAFGREEVIKKFEKAGVNNFLIKPVKQSILLDMIMDIFGKKQDHSISQTIETKDTTIDPGRLKGLRVLLAEDNTINQLVAEKMLEYAGVLVTIASTGLRAVELLETKEFDLVLMDIQMPEMDGYCATDIIRNKLKLKEIPVIAMTAHAMTGDREKCIHAGMNDYISKPIDSSLLYSKLIKYKGNKHHLIHQKRINLDPGQAEKAPSIHPSHTLPDALPGIDVKSGLSRFMGDTQLYVQLLADFINDHKNSMEKINTMVKEKKMAEVLGYLHSIKGIAGNLSLSSIYESTTGLEVSIEKNSTAARVLLNHYKKTFIEASNTVAKLNDLFINSQPIPPKKDKQEFGQKDILRNILILHEKIIENDLEAIDRFGIVKEMIQKKINPNDILSLDKAINNFDFDEAEVVLFKIARFFNITLKGM